MIRDTYICVTGTVAVAVIALFLTACTQPPDLDAVRAERQKPVQRYDNFQAAASNGRQLVSAGGGGVLVTSADGGKTWAREQLQGAASIVAMSTCPDGTFAALDFYRKAWIGDDQGRNWEARSVDADFNPMAITCDARNRLWIVGSFSTVVSSDDKGRTWTAQPRGEDAILTAIQFIDTENGYIAGEFGTLLVTHDGGRSWSKQPGLPPEFYPYSLVFRDAQNGWVSGLAGVILSTKDGGKTWLPQSNASAAPMYALLTVGDKVFGVGGGGVVLRLQDEHWVPVANTPRFPSYLAAGAPLQEQALLVAGPAGALSVVELPVVHLAAAPVPASNEGARP